METRKFLKLSVLKSKHLNNWRLFFLIFGINSLAMIGYMPTQDLSTPGGISEMIQASVRVCVPLLFLAFACSAIAAHSPKPIRQWLTRNRRSFGLGFAAGMGWQMFFILWILFFHTEYYVDEVYGGVRSFLVYRLGPYAFLTAMTITSFHPVRRKMNAKVWHLIHWFGIYYLWWDVTYTYFDEFMVYNDIQIVDYIYFALGMLGYFARVGERTRLIFRTLRKPVRLDTVPT